MQIRWRHPTGPSNPIGQLAKADPFAATDGCVLVKNPHEPEPNGYTFLSLCKIYDVENIYSAFGEVPPTQYHTDAAKDLANKYHLLHDAYKRIVEPLVVHLLEAQEKRRSFSCLHSHCYAALCTAIFIAVLRKSPHRFSRCKRNKK